MVNVDRSICIGCEMCVAVCPEVFEMGKVGVEDKSFVKDKGKWGKVAPGEIDRAIESCPVECISK